MPEHPRFEPDPDWRHPVVEYYKQFVDVSLLRENLKLTPEQRLRKAQSFINMCAQLRRAKIIPRNKSNE